MTRDLNLNLRVEKTREPLTTRSAVKFDLSEIKEHFDASLTTIREQFRVAEDLVSAGKSTEAEFIYRSQIVFLGSALDFFMHEITKYGLYRIFTKDWEITDKFKKLKIPVTMVMGDFVDNESTEWFFNYVNSTYASVVMQDCEVIKDHLNLIGIPWNNVCQRCNPGKNENVSVEKEKTKLTELYKRRNEIAHQTDRCHCDAKQQNISSKYVEEKIGDIEKFVCAVYQIADDKTKNIS